MRWDDVLPDTFNLSGGATGWGAALSSHLNVTDRDVLNLQVNGGRGIENYYNDAPIDVGPVFNLGDRLRPVLGRALPIWGMMAYYEHYWDKDKRWANTIGYSRVSIDNSNAQLPEAFRIGQYGGLTLIHVPTKNVMLGAEFQWGYRHNFEGDWRFNDYRIQTSFKYSYGHSFGGKSLWIRPAAATAWSPAVDRRPSPERCDQAVVAQDARKRAAAIRRLLRLDEREGIRRDGERPGAEPRARHFGRFGGRRTGVADSEPKPDDFDEGVVRADRDRAGCRLDQ